MARGKPSVTLAVVAERRCLAQAQPAGLISALRERGVAVRVVDADSSAVRVGAPAWLSEVAAVRRPSSFRPGAEGGRAGRGASEPVAVTLALRELALRCGRVFGLELFGVDCIEGPGGPWVIEVNEFPNYTGVARADELLADHVLAHMPRTGAADLKPSGGRRWTRR